MRVVALSNINHDGVQYVKDDVLDLSDSEGQDLIDIGSAASEQDNAESSNEQPEEQTLPESFTTPTGEYSTKKNVKGVTSGYLLDGRAIKKAEYQAAYEQSLDESGDEGQDEEDTDE